MQTAKSFVLASEDRELILKELSSESAGAATERSLILLYLDQGLKHTQIAKTLNIAPDKVSYWRKRYADHGLAACNVAGPRKKRSGAISAAIIRRILDKTREEVPENGRRWSTRSMASAMGVSESTIRRVWRHNGIAPHRLETAFEAECFTVGQECENISRLLLS